MNLLSGIKNFIRDETKKIFGVSDQDVANFEFKINFQREDVFGDVSCNVAMVIAKKTGRSPRDIAIQLQQKLGESVYGGLFELVSIAGPGFLNMTFTKDAWWRLFLEIHNQGQSFFKLEEGEPKKKFLVEFVSANPTGPLHLGHGRNAIIGDVLARVLSFLGHTVSREFYVNDAGSQIALLGQSFKARCMQQLGTAEQIPDGGYHGQYLVDLAKDCVLVQGKKVLQKDDQFFLDYARAKMLDCIKEDLLVYGIVFDSWFSETLLRDSGAIDKVLQLLQDKGLVYEHEGALWFKSSEFGDDKDRVIRKSDGQLTYIAADVAYHKDKFDRGFDILIDVLGHDHHGYVNRLKATMRALGYNADNLHVILYQLVSIKEKDAVVRMSKRAGTFTTLKEVVDAVGTDVARFFYLNRKSDAPLDFDLSVALKKTEENPVFYIQYAYVRIRSVLEKAMQDGFDEWVGALKNGEIDLEMLESCKQHIGPEEYALIKKIASLGDILRCIQELYHTHMLSFYALELAQTFHGYYTRNRVIDASKPEVTKLRLFVIFVVYQKFDLCLDLLGLNKPEKM